VSDELASGLLNQGIEEFDQLHMVEVAMDDPPTGFPLIAYGCNHQ
jgi:hypothetical protein